MPQKDSHAQLPYYEESQQTEPSDVTSHTEPADDAGIIPDTPPRQQHFHAEIRIHKLTKRIFFCANVSKGFFQLHYLNFAQGSRDNDSVNYGHSAA